MPVACNAPWMRVGRLLRPVAHALMPSGRWRYLPVAPQAARQAGPPLHAQALRGQGHGAVKRACWREYAA
ncbi:hypothetical protein S101446_01240 [Komagataeibacter europaeus]|nr:hypothetical protein S101446_01240 [Komagataeibacter europaeus]